MPNSTPLPEGSVIYIGKLYEGDPDSPLEAFLVHQATLPAHSKAPREEVWTPLGNSYGGSELAQSDTNEWFIWAMRAVAEFHKIDIQVEVDA